MKIGKKTNRTKDVKEIIGEEVTKHGFILTSSDQYGWDYVKKLDDATLSIQIKRIFLIRYEMDFSAKSDYDSERRQMHNIKTNLKLSCDNMGSWYPSGEDGFRAMLEEMKEVIIFYGYQILDELYVKVTDIPPERKIKREPEDERYLYDHNKEMAQRSRERLGLDVNSPVEEIIDAIQNRASAIGNDNFFVFKDEIYDMVALWGNTLLREIGSGWDWRWEEERSLCWIKMNNSELLSMNPQSSFITPWKYGTVDELYRLLKVDITNIKFYLQAAIDFKLV